MKYVYEDEKTKTRYTHYDSLSDIYRESPTPHNAERQDEITQMGDSDWWGVDGGLKAVRRCVERGWPEGKRKMDSLLQRIKEVTPIVGHRVRRRKIRSDFGNEVDVHSVLGGALDRAWTRTVKRTETGPFTVCLVVEVGANCGTEAEKMFWPGATAVALTDLFTTQGHNVEVLVSGTNRRCWIDRQGDSVISAVVKRSTEPLNLDLLAASTAIAGVFRGYILHALSCTPGQVSYDYGRASSQLPKVAENYQKVIHIKDIWSFGDAKAFIQKNFG